MGFIDTIFGTRNPTENFPRTYKLTSINIPVAEEVAYLNYAISVCVNKIANALSQCTIDTYENGREVKKNEWYAFNVEPNLNQNITDFWNKLVMEMVANPEGALVVKTYEGYYLIADSYNVKEFAVKDNIYTDVTVGNFTFDRAFNEKDVLRLKLSNTNIRYLINSVYKSYGKLLSSSIKNYNRGNSKKIFVKIGAMFDQFKNRVNPETGLSEYDETLDDLFKNRLKAYFSEADSATPIEEGLEIIDKTKDNASGKYCETDDIRKVFDDIINLCADAFNLPRGLLKGDVADVEAMTDNFITFCVNPIASLIEDEINRKLYGKEKVVAGTKLRIKTSTIRSYDATKLASSAEALFRIRAVNANWVRKMLREENINEKWADEYMETKNYQSIEKGGEGDG